MIITVTLNPAIDKTIEVDTFVYGGLNRIQNPIEDVGGKGINVSKTIKALGGESLAMGFLGKEGSYKIQSYLKEQGIQQDFVIVEGTTRTNLKIVEKNGTLTELNESGMTVTNQAVEQLLEKLKAYANPDTLFVLSGSVPKGAGTDIYARIIKTVKQNRASVYVDADGELLKEAIKMKPDMIKPNHRELAEYFGSKEELSKEECISLGKQLLEKEIEKIVISQGEKGAIFLNGKDGSVWYQKALPVQVSSAVGAGDAMLGALAYAWEQKLPWEESISLAMKAAAIAVETPGTKIPVWDRKS